MSDWVTAKLKEVAKVVTGKTPQTSNSEYYGGDIPFVSPADLNEGILSETKTYLTSSGADQVYRVPENTVLVSCIGNLGKLAITSKEVCFNQQINGLIFDEQKIFPKYGFYFAQTLKPQLEKASSSTTLPIVNKSRFSDLEIKYPPLAEQRRIASILDQADELRQKRQQAIEKLDQLLQATFIDMFGDPVSNPKGWEAKPIDNICANIVDCVNKTAPIVEYETPYKMIRTTNVRNHKVDISSVRYVEKETFDKWNRRLTPQRGDVILTREAPVGEVGILESDDSVFLGQRLMLYRVNLELTTPEYLLYFLMSDNLKMQYEQMSSGSTVKHLSVPQCSKWSIYLPPIELQLKFSEFYKMIHANLELMRISYNKADTLFKSLQNQAFNGTL